MASIKKNIELQTLYQILNTCLPLITAPYLSRVLGARQLGVFTYTQSIVNYYILFAMLGLNNYGTRMIASVANDIEKRSKIFWSIYLIQFVTCSIALTGYIVYINFICNENRTIALIQVISILACFFDINWIFFGLERFEITVTRNTIIRIFTVIMILTLVKKDDDLGIYVFLMSVSTFLSQIVLWIYIPQLVNRTKITFNDIIPHIKPIIILFIPIVAMSIYHIMDKTMLGLLSNYEETGYYYYTDKIINIPASIISGICIVMLPRISLLVNQKKIEDADKLFNKSLEWIIIVASALSYGIASIAKEFIPFFLGDRYSECINLTVLLAPILIIKGYSFTVRYEFLIPRENDNIYIYSVCVGVIANLIVNLIAIPKYNAMGAIWGTLAAEFVACVIQFILIRKIIDFKQALNHSIIYIFIGIIMYFVVRIIGNILVGGVIKLLLEIVIGIITYILMLYIYITIFKRNDLMNQLKLIIKKR